jgi:hypothetical protein
LGVKTFIPVYSIPDTEQVIRETMVIPEMRYRVLRAGGRSCGEQAVEEKEENMT